MNSTISGRVSTPLGMAVLSWTWVVTISRGFRWPNDFAEAHWLLDYRFGLIRRGLVGSVCASILEPAGLRMTPAIIAALATALLVALTIAIGAVLLRMVQRFTDRNAVLMLGLVFASSPFAVMSGHLLGYFDVLLYGLAVLSIVLVLRDRLLHAAILSSVAILVHEAFVLTGLPLVAFAAVMKVPVDREDVPQWRRLSVLILPGLTFLAVATLQAWTTDATTLRAQLSGHLASFGFVPRRSEGVAMVLTTPLGQFFRAEAGHFGARLCDATLVASIGPSVACILAFIGASVRMRLGSGVALLAVVGAPLAMHAVAWDTERIWTYVIPGALLATWILMETRATRSVPAWNLLVALPVLILNMSGHVPLMDGEWDRFTDPVRLLLYLPALGFVITVIGTHRHEIGRSVRQWNAQTDPFRRLALVGIAIAIAVNGAILSTSHGILEWIGWAGYYAGVQALVLAFVADWIPGSLGLSPSARSR